MAMMIPTTIAVIPATFLMAHLLQRRAAPNGHAARVIERTAMRDIWDQCGGPRQSFKQCSPNKGESFDRSWSDLEYLTPSRAQSTSSMAEFGSEWCCIVCDRGREQCRTHESGCAVRFGGDRPFPGPDPWAGGSGRLLTVQ